MNAIFLGTAACRECGSWGQEVIEIDEESISKEMAARIAAIEEQGYSREVSTIEVLKADGKTHLLKTSCDCVRCGASY